MTKTTRAGCTTNRLLRCADGISPPASCGGLTKADQKTLNLDDESRNDHQNAFIVQDGYSHWIQMSSCENKRCCRNCMLLAEMPAAIRKARKSRHRQFMEVYQKACQNHRHEYSSSLRNQQDRRKNCLTSTRRNSSSTDGAAFPKHVGTA